MKMKTQIFKSIEEFKNRENKLINGVSKKFAKNHKGFEKQNELNSGCWNCADCTNCVDCNNCIYCYNCFGCKNCWDCYRCKNCFSCVDCFIKENLKHKYNIF